MRRSATTDSGLYYDRVPSVIHSYYAQDSWRARPLQRSVSASVLPFLTVMTRRAEKARARPYDIAYRQWGMNVAVNQKYMAHGLVCMG